MLYSTIPSVFSPSSGVTDGKKEATGFMGNVIICYPAHTVRHMFYPSVLGPIILVHSITEKSPSQAFGHPSLGGFTGGTPFPLCPTPWGDTGRYICHIMVDNGDGWSAAKTGMVGPKGAGGKWICRQKRDLCIPDRGIPLSLGYLPRARGRQGIYHEHGNLT